MKDNKHSVVITNDDLVTVTQMNHVVEVQHMEKMNTVNHIKKLDKDRYVELKTGEIKEFEHIENRQGSLNSLRQTFKKLRYLINNNFTGARNELFITLTYRENMTDIKKLYDDFRKFIQRLKYQYKKESTIDYLCVVEPQARGAWHCHVLMRFNDLNNIFIENSELAKIWGLGFVMIKSLREVDNIGAYLSAYLTDIELTDDTYNLLLYGGVELKEVDGKRYIKGGRLYMYPSGMNIYRKSKGIKFPDRQKIKYGYMKKIVGCAKPHYIKKVEVKDNDFENTITYLQYNLMRQ